MLASQVHSAQGPLQLVNLSAGHDCQVSPGSRSNGSLKRHQVYQDMPASKRRRAGLTNNRPYMHPAPLVRINHRDPPHSPLTPRTTSRTRVVMDCVEVVPLDEVLRRREGGAKRDNGLKKQELGGAAEDQAGGEIMGAPKTPFVRRTVREQLERDEIGELFFVCH